MRTAIEKESEQIASVAIGYIDKFNITGLLTSGIEGYNNAKKEKDRLVESALFSVEVQKIRKDIGNTSMKGIIIEPPSGDIKLKLISDTVIQK